MSKRTVFTTITPLPVGVTRDVVLETLHSHVEMIDLNPLVIERHVVPAPRDATAEEYHCTWYSLTDRVSYLPGISGKVTYNACFHDLSTGVQTHVYAPLGLNIKERWTVGGSLPGEPAEPVELGIGMPKQGLYLREDCDMRCNIMVTKFVRSTLTKAHAVLVARLAEKAGLEQVKADNHRISMATNAADFQSLSPHYHDLPTYTERPDCHQQPAATSAWSPSVPRPSDEWQKQTRPVASLAVEQCVPEPLKLGRPAEGYTAMAYMPAAPNLSDDPGYLAHQHAPPRGGYSPYRPHNAPQGQRLSVAAGPPQQPPRPGSAPRSASAMPVELEG